MATDTIYSIESTYAFPTEYVKSLYDSFDEAEEAFRSLCKNVANHKHYMYKCTVTMREENSISYQIDDTVMSHEVWGEIVKF